MSNIELNEGTNQLEIVGTLKSKDLEQTTNKNGIAVIRGNIVVEWKDKDHLQNTRVNVYATQFGRRNPTKELPGYISAAKLFSDEYKDKDSFGEGADRIVVRGNVGYNPYVSRDGQIRETNRLSGQFFRRIDKEDGKYTDHASALLSLTVTGYTDVMKDNVPTENKRVSAFNVGYGERIIPIIGLQFSMDNFDDSVIDEFTGVIAPGETAVMEVAFNNYEVVTETPAEEHGFGGHSQMSLATNYVNNAEIVYSNGVVFDPEGTNGLTRDQIMHAKELKDQHLADVEAKYAEGAAMNTQAPGGFGKATQQTAAPTPVTQATQTSSIPEF